MKHSLFFCATVALAVLSSAADLRAEVVAYWNFNTYDGNATSVAATSGTGAMSMATFATNRLDAVAGTTINTLNSDAAGTAVEFSHDGNNGNSFTLSFSMTGRQDLSLTYADFRSATGFSNNQWAYSANGSAFSSIATTNPGLSYGLQSVDFSSITALDNAANVVLRYTLNGGSSGATAEYTIDNIQLNAAAIPEPSSVILSFVAAAGLGGWGWRRRRRLSR